MTPFLHKVFLDQMPFNRLSPIGACYGGCLPFKNWWMPAGKYTSEASEVQLDDSGYVARISKEIPADSSFFFCSLISSVAILK